MTDKTKEALYQCLKTIGLAVLTFLLSLLGSGDIHSAVAIGSIVGATSLI